MVEEVRRQFRTVPVLANGEKDFTHFKADYSHCVRISTEASLRMMVPPWCAQLLRAVLGQATDRLLRKLC
jgi:Na+/H+-translocating membrane pyrophosphatase